MKKYLLIIICFTFLVSCEKKKIPEPKKILITKVIKAKNTGEETTYHYKYNFWRGNFYHVPDVHSVYYLIFTDGSFNAVDVDTYTVKNIGDTIQFTKYEY